MKRRAGWGWGFDTSGTPVLFDQSFFSGHTLALTESASGAIRHGARRELASFIQTQAERRGLQVLWLTGLPAHEGRMDVFWGDTKTSDICQRSQYAALGIVDGMLKQGGHRLLDLPIESAADRLQQISVSLFNFASTLKVGQVLIVLDQPPTHCERDVAALFRAATVATVPIIAIGARNIKWPSAQITLRPVGQSSWYVHAKGVPTTTVALDRELV